MSEGASLDCEAPLSLGDALARAVSTWVAEGLHEPASVDRDRRLENLMALSVSLSHQPAASPTDVTRSVCLLGCTAGRGAGGP